MPSSSQRAPLVLAAIALLGIGGRLLRQRAEERAGSSSVSASPAGTLGNARVPSALDSQIARVDEVSGTATRTNRSKSRATAASSNRATSRPTRRSGETYASKTPTGSTPEPRDGASAATAIRVESTPPGALPSELRFAEVAAAENAPVAGRRRPGVVTDRSAKKPAPTSFLIVDVDRASAAEIERLPRIGPALAKRIVADRAANGPFRSLDGLQRVRGIGPSIARQLQGHVTFGGEGRP
jgi:DNA uptake protein ComE-like DNA-binding protein